MTLVLIPAKNVEKTLEKAILSAYESLNGIDGRIIVIENGSSDNTPQVAEKLTKTPRIPLTVITSKPGKITAFLTGLEYAAKGEPLIFMDGDVESNKDTFKILLDQMSKHPELVSVGGFPKLNSTYTLPDKFAYLNLFTFFPLAKTVRDERYGFNNAKEDPQPNIPADMEKRLKSFFHGRIYLIREKRFIPTSIPKENIADDIFWNRHLFLNYGKGCIRNRYDATVFFKPKISEKELIQYNSRINRQVDSFLKQFPEYTSLNDVFEVHKDWSYINTLPSYIIKLFEKEHAIYSNKKIFEQIEW